VQLGLLPLFNWVLCWLTSYQNTSFSTKHLSYDLPLKGGGVGTRVDMRMVYLGRQFLAASEGLPLHLYYYFNPTR
jgi:hypothetical protein